MSAPLQKGAAQIRAACVRLAQARAGEIGAGKLGETQVRPREIGPRKIHAAEIRGFERRAHEAHRLVLFVRAAIRVFELSADEARAGQVGGDARAHEICAVEMRARELRREEARLDEVGPGEIDAKRPGLVQRRPVEICAAKGSRG